MRLIWLFVLALACVQPEPVKQVEPKNDDLLHKRIEQIRDDPATTVAGVTIAAKRLVPELYVRRDFTRAWRSAAARDDLLRAIRDSAQDGLDPADYLLSALERAREVAEAPRASLEAQIDYDLLQSEALIRLLYHVIFGKVDPESFDTNWSFTRKLHLDDPAVFVQGVIDSGELYARVQREYPQHEMYVNLKAELAKLRARESAGPLPAIDDGPTLKPGANDPRVVALRARLAAEGDLIAGAPLDSTLYDAAVETSVVALQTRHGLDPDGAVGPATLAALNATLAAAIEKVRVNLERGRWLLHDPDPTFVVVNVAGFQAYYLHDGKVVWTARAQVGKPYRATPIFRSTMTYLVLNPTWTVPPSILEHDILPERRRDPTTLTRKKLDVIDHAGRPVSEASIDWANATPKNFRYMLRQGPGPDNALGRVKFMFPNEYSVYLHDTPSKALFAKSDRAFSSGCIRIEYPFELATLLLEGQDGWDRAAIDRAVDAGTTRTVTLAKPVPVLVSYWTAWVNATGTLQLRADVYGRDAKVAEALAAEFALPPPKP